MQKLLVSGFLILLILVGEYYLESSKKGTSQQNNWEKRSEQKHKNDKNIKYNNEDYYENATVESVIDGDTLIIKTSSGKKEHLRLIGVDCPEMRENEKAIRDSIKLQIPLTRLIELGTQSFQFTRSLVNKGDTIMILYDSERFDRFERLLGYVYLSNGAFLNDELIKQGYAKPLKIKPNIRFSEMFNKSYLNAKEKGVGLWQKESF